MLFNPAGLDGYLRVTTDVSIAYGLTSQFTLFGRASWSYARLDQSPASTTAYGFGDQMVGISFRALEQRPPANRSHGLALDIQFQAELPPYSNAAADVVGIPHLGDGAIDLTLGPFLTTPLIQTKRESLLLTVGSGFTYRTQLYAFHIPWSVNVHYLPRLDGIFGSLGGYGAISLRNDGGASPVTGLRPATGSGGSYVTEATNPSFLMIRGQAGYQFANLLQIYLEGTQALWGQLAANGFSGLLGLKFHFGERSQGNPVTMSPKDYGRSNQGFVNYAMEARVLRANDRLNLVKIDKGMQDGVEVGQVFDIFMVKQDGSLGEAIARSKVTSVKVNEAALTVSEYFREVWIEEGYIAKRPLF